MCIRDSPYTVRPEKVKTFLILKTSLVLRDMATNIYLNFDLPVLSSIRLFDFLKHLFVKNTIWIIIIFQFILEKLKLGLPKTVPLQLRTISAAILTNVNDS